VPNISFRQYQLHAYMAGKNNGAVKLFSQMTNNQCFRIPCSLHVAHIILTSFENIAFGKLASSVGFSKQSHPFNLLYLAWETSQWV